MTAPTIPCTRCHGNGHARLKGPLLRTYNAIAKLGQPTVPEIVRALGEQVHPTAVNRRVERLKAMRLIRSRAKAHDGVRYTTVSS
jgi:hypothetical protein